MVFVAFLSIFLFTPINAGAWNNTTDHAWATPNPSGWSTCTPKNDCGPEGTQTQTVSCIHKEGSNEDCSTHNDEWRYADKVRSDEDEWKCPSRDSAYTSTDSTKDCKKKVDVGPDTKVISQDCTLTDYKACVSPTPTPTSTPQEQHHFACVENSCQWVEGSGDNTCNPENEGSCQTQPTPTPTPTPTPAPTQAPSNPGGPGDGRSDGLSSCPSCTQAPQGSSATQAVLGASTGPAVLGLSTTSGEESAMPLIQLLGALFSAGVGFKFFKKNA